MLPPWRRAFERQAEPLERRAIRDEKRVERFKPELRPAPKLSPMLTAGIAAAGCRGRAGDPRVWGA
jgi:hypothetical protein